MDEAAEIRRRSMCSHPSPLSARHRTARHWAGWHAIGHRLLSQFRTSLGANVNRGLQINDITAPLLFRRSHTDRLWGGARSSRSGGGEKRKSSFCGHFWLNTAGLRSAQLCIFSVGAFISSVSVNLTFLAWKIVAVPWSNQSLPISVK